MMTLFYVLHLGMVWESDSGHKNRLGNLINVASKVLGRSRAQLTDLYSRQVCWSAMIAPSGQSLHCYTQVVG